MVRVVIDFEMVQGLAIVVEAQDFDLVLVLASFIACLNATQCRL